MSKKVLKRRHRESPQERIFTELIRKLHRVRSGRTGAKRVAYTLEECSLAVLATLLSLRMDQEPQLLLADAHGLLNEAKDFLSDYAPEFDSDEERKLASHLSLTLKESMRALGYTSYGGFWCSRGRRFVEVGG